MHLPQATRRKRLFTCVKCKLKAVNHLGFKSQSNFSCFISIYKKNQSINIKQTVKVSLKLQSRIVQIAQRFLVTNGFSPSLMSND